MAAATNETSRCKPTDADTGKEVMATREKDKAVLRVKKTAPLREEQDGNRCLIALEVMEEEKDRKVWEDEHDEGNYLASEDGWWHIIVQIENAYRRVYGRWHWDRLGRGGSIRE